MSDVDDNNLKALKDNTSSMINQQLIKMKSEKASKGDTDSPQTSPLRKSQPSPNPLFSGLGINPTE